MKNKIIYICLALAIIFSSCDNQFAPADDNHLTFDYVKESPSTAEALLYNAYTNLPGYNYASDVATDNAVTNNKYDGYKKIATGQWTSKYNPTSQWQTCYDAILNINNFLSVVDNINWAPVSGEPNNTMFKLRNKGEAYGLRAYLYYKLLVAHAGLGIDGTLYGVPIITQTSEDLIANTPRSTFKQCIMYIYNDIETAQSLLPLDFKDITSESDIPQKYKDTGTSVDQYNAICGYYSQQRITSRILMGLKSEVALLAASPAYGIGSYDDAANYAADVLDLIGGISGLDPNGETYYSADNVENISINTGGADIREILWRTSMNQSNWSETKNFPPTLYGEGNVNPTQNLVDAFPMANGYPITSAESNYDENNPYENRDPRLTAYIVYNGATFSNKKINVEDESGDDAVNAIPSSTTTGYYMKKLLREDTNLNPNTKNSQKHFTVYMRYTEIFLNYAEAANEAWGPDGKGTHSYSARDVIAALRQRAGIDINDPYLASISSKDEMRILIRNERRIELCFEGFRFWDLRRWKADLNEAAEGITITNDVISSSKIVEERIFKDYMNYGPIPYQEVLKFQYIQNQGW